VPEESFIRDAQVAILLQKLAGNKCFGRRRGQMGERLSDMLASIIDSTASPTAALRQWDALASDIRVLINNLAVLKRDGNDLAREEFFSALTQQEFTFTGESFPLKETLPRTIVMFGAPQTFTLLEWITCGHWNNLNRWIDCKDGKIERGQLDLVGRVFEAFPSLEKFTRLRQKRGDYEGWDLLYAYSDDVLSHYEIGDDLRGLHMFDGYNDHLEIVGKYNAWPVELGLPKHYEGNFIFIFEGEQDELLSRYSREQQKSIATWQLHVPTFVWEKVRAMNVFKIELHLEEQREQRQRVQPALTSRGVSHGYGARLMVSNEGHRSCDQMLGEQYFTFVHRS